MKLHGMRHAYDAVLESKRPESITHDELIHLLVQAEWENREGRKVNRYLKGARFRYQASIEEIDFTRSRNLDKTLLLRLADGSFIKKGGSIGHGPFGRW